MGRNWLGVELQDHGRSRSRGSRRWQWRWRWRWRRGLQPRRSGSRELGVTRVEAGLRRHGREDSGHPGQLPPTTDLNSLAWPPHSQPHRSPSATDRDGPEAPQKRNTAVRPDNIAPATACRQADRGTTKRQLGSHLQTRSSGFAPLDRLALSEGSRVHIPQDARFFAPPGPYCRHVGGSCRRRARHHPCDRARGVRRGQQRLLQEHRQSVPDRAQPRRSHHPQRPRPGLLQAVPPQLRRILPGRLHGQEPAGNLWYYGKDLGDRKGWVVASRTIPTP